MFLFSEISCQDREKWQCLRSRAGNNQLFYHNNFLYFNLNEYKILDHFYKASIFFNQLKIEENINLQYSSYYIYDHNIYINSKGFYLYNT